MSDILPTGYTAIFDLQQGARNAFTGSIAGVEGGAIVEPLYTPDEVVTGHWYRATEAFSTTEEFYRLDRKFKAWTLDWVDLQMVIPTDTNTLSVALYKVSVGDANADIVSGDRIGAAITFLTSSAAQRGTQIVRLAMHNLKEIVRRFEPGETLAIGFDLNSSTLTVTEIEVSWLGRSASA